MGKHILPFDRSNENYYLKPDKGIQGKITTCEASKVTCICQN